MRIRKKRQHSRKIVEGDRNMIELSDETLAIIEKQRAAFRQKFGRDPGPGDPLFFDPNKDEPTKLNDEHMATMGSQAMRAVGVDEEFIYAWEKTALLLTEDSPHTEEEIAEWNAAIQEYRTKQCH